MDKPNYIFLNAKLFSDDGHPYVGEGIIRYAKIDLKELKQGRENKKTLDVVLNVKGFTKAERKIARFLNSQRALVEGDLGVLLRKDYK